ncbi:hypothetical protein ACOSQ3_022562 [Xanthoceras sorbifolium]
MKSFSLCVVLVLVLFITGNEIMMVDGCRATIDPPAFDCKDADCTAKCKAKFGAKAIGKCHITVGNETLKQLLFKLKRNITRIFSLKH